MSDLTFWAWFYTCAGALVLAFASALYLSATNAPTGRHRAGASRPMRVELDGLRVPAYYRRTPEPFPATASELSPAPVHLPTPERTPPVSPTRQQIEARVIKREQRARLVVEPVVEPAATPEAEYRPITGRVVPLWDRTEERLRQVRLQALTALAEGLPDPEYTYEGAHCLGAVA